MSNIKLFVFVLTLVFTSVVSCVTPTQTHVSTVESFVAAFNAQDSSAMANHVTNDVEWLSIAGDQVTVEVSGKVALVESMDDYFKSCPTCRSALSKLVSTTERVSAVEIASWQGASGVSSQTAISIYEFTDGLINRVYYFQTEK